MRSILLLILTISLTLSVTVQAAEPTVHEYKLSNGLTVLVKEDHRAPVVLTEVWYKIGSSYEPNGITGISHMLEHMMFKGTPNYPGNKFSELIAENGGEQNAFTDRDYTAYYQELAVDKLPLSLKLEADRMRNLSLLEKDFTSELHVVQEERKLRIDNVPQAKTYERFQAAAFVANPYHHPVIGWPSDLEHMTINDVRDWYKTWYAPNNAYLVVVGDVNPEQVFNLANQYFGSLKPSVLPIVKPHQDLTPIGTRAVTVNTPAKLPVLFMGYNTPSLITVKNSDEAYALEVLAAILGGTDSSRLQKELIRGKQIAATASSGYDLYARLPSLITISAVPAQNHSVADLQKAIENQIQILQTQLVEAKELDRIKAQVIANKTFARDSIATQAYLIGSLEAIGSSWQEMDNYVEKVQKVTPEQIQQAAKKYLIPDRLTITILEPQPIETTPSTRNTQGGNHV